MSPRDSWIDAPPTCFITSLRQQESVETLDVILTSDDQSSGQLVSEVTVQSVRFSDHCLVKCCLGVPPTPPSIVTYSYRSLRKIDIASFGRDILRSRLYDSSGADVDEFAEVADAAAKMIHPSCWMKSDWLIDAPAYPTDRLYGSMRQHHEITR